MSFGKEIEQMQKQFQDEMQARINELENMLNAKEQELVYEAQKNEQKLTSLTKTFQAVNKENQDLKL
jgi:outer membrane protease